MEGEAKVRGSRCRRRERAARMQKQAMRGGQSADEGDESPGRSSKPPRPPNRKKRNKEPIFEEDVIDGFAILSFRTYEDLEVSVRCANSGEAGTRGAGRFTLWDA
ncbi:fibrosin-1-like protein [Dermacentor silvarum]|uniref:fibrosin-1-like protein n=1 Tax=Dermacentor silvarum TaxID=543639 RepID=UPI00189ACFBD|nr:fibrosin-1-like protein [Dermacentor silvarum]